MIIQSLSKMENIQINKDDCSVLLRFNRKLYPDEIVETAKEHFAEVCIFQEDDFGLKLIPKDILDLDIIGYEFLNYALGLIKK